MVTGVIEFVVAVSGMAITALFGISPHGAGTKYRINNFGIVVPPFSFVRKLLSLNVPTVDSGNLRIIKPLLGYEADTQPCTRDLTFQFR